MTVKELISVSKGIKTFEFFTGVPHEFERYNADLRTNTVDAGITKHLDETVLRVFAIKSNVIRIDSH